MVMVTPLASLKFCINRIFKAEERKVKGRINRERKSKIKLLVALEGNPFTLCLKISVLNTLQTK